MLRFYTQGSKQIGRCYVIYWHVARSSWPGTEPLSISYHAAGEGSPTCPSQSAIPCQMQKMKVRLRRRQGPAQVTLQHKALSTFCTKTGCRAATSGPPSAIGPGLGSTPARGSGSTQSVALKTPTVAFGQSTANTPAGIARLQHTPGSCRGLCNKVRHYFPRRWQRRVALTGMTDTNNL